MNIALHGRDDDFAFAFARLPTLLQGVTNHLKRGFCRFRAHQKLRQKQRAFFKALADHVKCRHQLIFHNFERSFGF